MRVQKMCVANLYTQREKIGDLRLGIRSQKVTVHVPAG